MQMLVTKKLADILLQTFDCVGDEITHRYFVRLSIRA